MRLRIRLQPDGTWLKRELLRRAWTYRDLAHHAGLNRMTLYFLLHPGLRRPPAFRCLLGCGTLGRDCQRRRARVAGALPQRHRH
jgi:hypothetical protein